MRDLKLTKHMLLAVPLTLLAAAAATTTVAAAPASASASATSAAGWSYWTSTSAEPHLVECASEVAKVQGVGTVSYLYRASSDDACAQSLAEVHHAREEVVVFKQEALQEDAMRTALASTWKHRALTALVPDAHDAAADEASNQLAFHLATASTSEAIRLISVDEDALLLAVSHKQLATIDKHATFDTRLERLIFHPVSRLAADEIPKPEPSFENPKYNTVIAKIASSSAFHPERIKKDVRILTGEDVQPKQIGTWHSRHSSTYGARLAAEWIKQQLQQSLAALNGSTCEFFEYSAYFAPNVVCRIAATSAVKPKGEVVISAHYDSRGSFGSTTAPGGDDDGSGTAALLAIARSIGSSALRFSSPIQLIAFSGEEQGLVGSQHYAAFLHTAKVPVKLALQMDMLAYRKPGEPMQIAFPDKFVTNTATQLVWAITHLYAPELQQGYTPACCSDHQSFWQQDFPATWVFERHGPIADPMYHNSADVSDRLGYDLDQLSSIAKVVTATLLHVAHFGL